MRSAIRFVSSLRRATGSVFVWACGDIKTVTEIRRFITTERAMGKGTFKT
jgi:hypothetical protein